MIDRARLQLHKPVSRQHALPRGIARLCGRLVYRRQIKANASARILVCLQLFYPESWPEIAQYLMNLSPYHPDICISYHADRVSPALLAQMQAFSPAVRLLCVENMWFDIAPFLAQMRQFPMDAYDIIFKLHSKGTGRRKIYLYGQLLKKRDWFLCLFEGILGSFTVHKTIDTLLRDPTAGMVAAKNLIVRDPIYKQHFLRCELPQIAPAMDIPEDYRFVAGTCFAAKAEVLQQLAQASFQFSRSPAGVFSVAHCLERALCFPAQTPPYHMVGNTVCRLRRAARMPETWIAQRYDAARLLRDPRFQIDEEFFYRAMETRPIAAYRLGSMRLGDILRKRSDGSVVPLERCEPYLYLAGQTEPYAKYCEENWEKTGFPMNEDRYRLLLDSLASNGFDVKHPIIVNSQGILLDGQHRACALLHLHGPEYQVTVLWVQFLFERIKAFIKSRFVRNGKEQV